MDRAREEYEAMTQLFIRISYEYKYDLTVNQSNKTLTMKVTDSGHELTFSYIYGNFKIFTVDEWDAMTTLNTTNLQYLPSDIMYRVAKWKKQISERS
jgi:hypothetical protein